MLPDLFNLQGIWCVFVCLCVCVCVRACACVCACMHACRSLYKTCACCNYCTCECQNMEKSSKLTVSRFTIKGERNISLSHNYAADSVWNTRRLQTNSTDKSVCFAAWQRSRAHTAQRWKSSHTLFPRMAWQNQASSYLQFADSAEHRR